MEEGKVEGKRKEGMVRTAARERVREWGGGGEENDNEQGERGRENDECRN